MREKQGVGKLKRGNKGPANGRQKERKRDRGMTAGTDREQGMKSGTDREQVMAAGTDREWRQERNRG